MKKQVAKLWMVCAAMCTLNLEAQTIYVSPEGAGSKSGSSWANAIDGNSPAGNGYTKLADTLAGAAPSAVFWIAEGTYLPSTDNDREKSFQLPELVAVYGGFAGNETALDQRDIAAHPTILSGNISDPALETDNACHVLITIGPYWYQHAFLNGLTITGGYAQDAALPNNAVQKYGGAIYSSHKLTIEHCRFHHNKATSGGGAIYIKDYGISSWMINELIVNHCQFDNNSLLTNSRGGAIQVYRNTRAFPSTIQNTLFFNNNGFYGSAINAHGTCTLNNCLLANNSAQSGALVVEYGSANIHHSTIVNNSGRGVFVMTGGNVQLKNSIVWGGGPVIGMSGTTYTAEHSCLEGGDTLNGNVNTDPLFVNPSPGNGSAFPGDVANWRLRWCSPCFNTGDSTLVYPGTATDLDGEPRVRYTQTDMGAYELDTTGLVPNVVNYAATPLFVTDSAQYYGDGNSWNQALAGNAESCKYPGQTLLYEAMKDAAPGVQLWVKKGVYKSTTTGNRNHYFELSDGVLVYGGFEGTESDTSQRGNGVTLFSGDYGLAGDSTDNARHVLKINAANTTFADTAFLDRIQIRHGHADGTGDEANGAGIWVGTGSKLKLNHCKVERNSAKSVGSGIYTQAGTHLLLNHSDVSRNTQRTTTSSSGTWHNGSPGCGVYNQGKLTAFQSRFNHNRNASEGIAIYNTDSLWMYHCSLDSNESIVTATRGGALSSAKYTRLFNCSLQRNQASILGGGAWNKASSYLEMDSCLVGFNQCTSVGNARGGGLCNDGQLILVNTSLMGNQSAYDGGGLYIGSSGVANVDDCVIAFNKTEGSTGTGGGGVCNFGILYLNRDKICNNSSHRSGGGVYNPTEVRNCLVANNSIGGGLFSGGGLMLAAGCQGVYHSTIVNNSGEAIAASYWMGMNVYLLPDTFDVHNCIIHGNTEVLEGHFDVTHSMIQGTAIGQGTNIPDDPVFVNPISGTGTQFNGLDADWSLTICSPCINKGNSNYLAQPDSLDLLRNQRLVGEEPDMGAYEFQSSSNQSMSFMSGKVFITDADTASGMGTSWSDSLSGNAPSCKYPGYTLFYEALRDMPSPGAIWLKKGTYFPSVDDSRDKSLVVKRGLHILGGFAGWEQVEEERDPVINRTIISGDIGLKNDSTDNSYHLLITTQSNYNNSDTTMLSGLTFSDGNANGSNSNGTGAAILNEESHPVLIDHCNFNKNFALVGASVYNKGIVWVRNSFFSNNHSTNSPGIYNLDSAFVSGCNFNRNTGFGVLTNLSGAFLYAQEIKIDTGYVGEQYYINRNPSGILNSGTFILKNSSIINQSGTTFEGGAVKNSGSLSIDSCLFFKNVTTSNSSCINNSGLIYVSNSIFNKCYSTVGTIKNSGNFEMINCLISNNNGGLMGPGFVYFGAPGGVSNSGTMTITKSVFENNFAAGGGGAIVNSGQIAVYGSTFENNSSGYVLALGTGMIQIYYVSNGFNGGAIKNSGSCTLDSCLFLKNYANYGAAISHLSGNMAIHRTKIIGNYALLQGAALLNQSNLTLSEVLVVNNHSKALNGVGSVISHGTGSCTLIKNSTFANNFSGNSRFIETGVQLNGPSNGSIYSAIPDTLIIQNSVFNGNSSTLFSNINQSLITSTFSSNETAVTGAGNLVCNTQFVNPTNFIGLSPDSSYNYSSANWTLSACSPCIDAGNDTLVADTTDLAGNARIYNRVDMGAYELAYNNALVAGEAMRIGRDQALLNWENLVKPCRTTVFLKPVATGQPTPEPSATYLADTVFGQGTNLDGWYCVFNGSGDSVTISGLTAGTTYRVAVFNYLFNQTYDTPLLHNFTTEQIVMPDMVKIFGDAPFTLQATAASGITSFDYTTDSLQVCTIAGDTATLSGCGTALIKVRHAGNSHYLPDSTTALLTVNFQMDVPQQINGPDTVCRGDAQVLYAISPLARATSYGWTLPQGVTGSSDSASIMLTFGTGATSGVVSVHGINACGEGEAANLPVAIGEMPLPSIAGPDTLCQSTTAVTYTTQPGQGNYLWSLTQGGAIASGQGTSQLTVLWNTPGSDTVAVSYASPMGCQAANPTALAVVVKPQPPEPSSITGDTLVCDSTQHTYTVSSIAGVDYQWTLPSGSSVVSGQGTNQITALLQGAGGTISVATHNDCGTSTPTSLEAIITQIPATAGTIAGSAIPCTGTTHPYNVTPQPGVTFNWMVPQDWTLLSGQGTAAITVSIGTSQGAVGVVASNFCGQSDTSFLAVSPATTPSQPGGIAGTTDTCSNVTDLTYSVPPLPGVSYNWIVPNGWSITSGQGTASITVTTGTQGGLLWAIPSNVCGTGPGDSLEIAVLQPPAQPSAINGSTLCCQGDTLSFGVEPLPGVSYQWQIPAGWSILTGQGTAQINAVVGYNGGAVTVTPSNVCGEGQPATTSVAVNFVQADAGTNQQIAYGSSTTLPGNATNGSGNYSWNWQPASLLLNPTLQNPVTTSLTATQQFTLQVGDQLTGCADTDTVLVEVQGMPLAAYGTATPDTTCPGSMVQLNAVALYGTGQYEYIWTSNPAGFLSTLPDPQVFPEQSTYYNLVVTDGNATVTDEVIVTVTPLPEAPGQPTGPDTVDIALTPTSSYFTLPVSGATGYQWSLEPWMIGTLSPNGNQATVQWSNIGTAMLTVSALNDCGLSTSEPLPVLVDNTIGVAALQPDGVVVTPNPFGDALTVASRHATPLSVELFDASGALVATLANPQPVSTLPTAGLVPGVYHLRVTFANGVVVKKVVKE